MNEELFYLKPYCTELSFFFFVDYLKINFVFKKKNIGIILMVMSADFRLMCIKRIRNVFISSKYGIARIQ